MDLITNSQPLGGAKRQFRKFFKNAFNVTVLSEFDEGIAPKYHHDRCERSVQMRLYTMSKGSFALVISSFVVSFLLCLFIGLAGPTVITSRLQKASDLPTANTTDISTGPFVLRSPLVSSYCQELWLLAEILIDSAAQGASYQQPFNSSVVISTVINNKNVEIFKAHNRTNSLLCVSTRCHEVIVAHLGQVWFPQYTFTISWSKELKDFDQRFHIRDVQFYWKTYNPSFSKLEIWCRFLFMIISFGVTLWFIQSLRSYSVYNWSMEQRWMGILLPLLLLYNNPVFPMSFVSGGWFTTILDVMFQANFLCALMLFWLCVYHGIRQSSRPFLKFYLPKMIVVSLLWLSAVVLGVWDGFNQSRNPTFIPAELDTGNFEGFKVFFYVLVALYTSYLIYLLIRAYVELRNLPYFDVRLKFFTVLMICAICATVSMVAVRFGVITTLQDNFKAQLSTQFSSSVEFMATYGLLNLYLFTMAYVYSPNSSAIAEFQFKNEEVMSALNDSEDEIVYNDNDLNEKLRRPNEPDDSSDAEEEK